MNEPERKALLDFVRNKPEWHSALIYQQLGTLNKTAATLSKMSAYLEQGFAESKLRPDRYFQLDRMTRKDALTGALLETATALGEALAALELITVLSDAHPQDFRYMAEYSCDLKYKHLGELCTRHKYKEES